MLDPPGGSPDIPDVLGMNVLSRCFQELFGHHGAMLFEDSKIIQAFQECQRAMRASDHGSNVKVRERSICRISGGTIKFVAATCSAQ